MLPPVSPLELPEENVASPAAPLLDDPATSDKAPPAPEPLVEPTDSAISPADALEEAPVVSDKEPLLPEPAEAGEENTKLPLPELPEPLDTYTEPPDALDVPAEIETEPPVELDDDPPPRVSDAPTLAVLAPGSKEIEPAD